MTRAGYGGSRHAGKKALLALVLGLAGTGCDLLPSDGPNANGMLSHASGSLKSDAASTAVTRYVLVSINARIADLAIQFYQPAAEAPPALFQKASGAFGGVGVGDVLRVTIWEQGDVGLFVGRDRKSTDVTVRVDTDGTIALPYAGRFPVAGRRLADVEATIVQRLQGQAAQPQATVIVMENVASSVSVQGEVNKPGPYPIAKANQHVLDAIAMAGGAKYPVYETLVSVTRGRAKMQAYLQDVIDKPDIFNVPVSAGDAVLLTRKQQKFLAFGAVAQPGEQAFRKETLKLSDGLGQVLGLDPTRSDAKGIYLFRREPLELARRYGLQPLAEDQGTMPIVYQLDLKDPKSFFAMTSFPLEPNDILFVSTAPLSEASRFFQILSGATNTVAIPRTLLGNYPGGN
jgi:polysaccharide export outer membrane protein